MKIHYLKHSEINKQKWDEALLKSLNQEEYALSWYLDVVSPGWEALIADDFRFLMPLPAKSKFGFHYLVQPLFVKQLGIFSSHKISEDIVSQFLKKIPAKFLFQNFSFNAGNTVLLNNSRTYNNHVLDLSPHYNDIRKTYSRNCKRNIKKAQNSNIEIKTNLSITEFVEFKYKYAEITSTKDLKQIKKTLEQLITKAFSFNKGLILGAYCNNELCSEAFFIQGKNKNYYLICASSETGKKTQALYRILDFYIQQNSGQQKILDFTGSNLKGVAYFNESFGAIPIQFKSIKKSFFNSLTS